MCCFTVMIIWNKMLLRGHKVCTRHITILMFIHAQHIIYYTHLKNT